MGNNAADSLVYSLIIILIKVCSMQRVMHNGEVYEAVELC